MIFKSNWFFQPKREESGGMNEFQEILTGPGLWAGFSFFLSFAFSQDRFRPEVPIKMVLGGKGCFLQ